MKKLFQVRMIDALDGEILSTAYFDTFEDAIDFMYEYILSESLDILFEVSRRGVRIL